MRECTQSRFKAVKLTCDRCERSVEGIRNQDFTAGVFDMTKWEEYRRGDKRYVCVPCMFADPKYLERYGSSF